MAQTDTLNLDGFRRSRELPMAAIANANHPEAAAAARARISEISDAPALEVPADLPTMPTEKLVLDKERLRKTLAEQPEVVATRPVLPSMVQPILTAIGIFLLILIVFKSPVIFSQIGYTFHKTSTPATQATTAAASIIPAEPSITIPKINVHAPIVYGASTDETAFEHDLESGVAHYGNTAVPGQVGNVALFGHSSNDWWQPGNYKFVFVLLDKLSPGDQITIDYQSKRYTYEVTGSRIVEPTEVSVLNPTTTPTLSLITCTPPGTSWKRLVVTAKQIDPVPSTSTLATPTPATSQSATNLSSGSSGFFSQVSKAWKGFTEGVGSLFGHTSSSTSTTTSTGSISAPASLPAAN